jgi:HEAT repeat protein
MTLVSVIVAYARPGFVEDHLQKVMIAARSEDTAWLAAYKLYNVNPMLALSHFLTLVKESDSPELRGVALNGLVLARSHLDDSHLKFIRQVLDDSSPKVRETACFVLGRLRDTASVRPICWLLQDEVSTTRIQACEALAEIGSKEAINDLQTLITDQDEDVRNAAYVALWRVCRQNAVELLPSRQEAQ